ncbi:hypothetical protein BGW36DRAFT_317534 [Talaromyces proteolyticus]|uniref:Uncharacterized protein n=1 Tax=Talaromyces proteolyticus TaxID=1131652 RepID=A0AAD4KW93_9EURO|nr:uncharacterized protein BGW36DRAFT_317534 [Talaromyces proteolyticus]KAH8701161.1 hypothetical protein BGW36DRAFT_317534 [Talaromyces proteolyticus]
MLRVGHSFRYFQVNFRQCRAYSQGSRLGSRQQVKLRRPWLRRFATACLVYGVATHLYINLLYTHFDKEITHSSLEDSDLKRKDSINGDSDADSEEEPSFIPLTWPRLKPGELYKDTDAEWLTFVKISEDKERLRALRAELADIVRQQMSKSLHGRRLFGTPLQVTESWLIPRFPYRAPPHYERFGLEISDTEIALVSQPVLPRDGDQIWKILFPFSVSLAAFHASFYLGQKKIREMKALLRDDGHTNDTIMSIKDLDLQSDLKSPKNFNLPSFSEWEILNSNPTEEIQENSSSADEKPARNYPSHLPSSITILQNIPRPDLKPGSDLHFALSVFKLSLSRSRLLHRKIPQRGVFYFSGPVALHGPKGEFRVEATGEYDPAHKKWTTVRIYWKDITFFAQEALGNHNYDQDD